MHTNARIQYQQGRNATLVGMAANFLLIFIKIIGGWFLRSQALVADGFHSLSDLLSDVVVLLALKWGRSDEDEEHPFGHGRIETLASFTVGLTLAGVGAGMAVSSGTDLYYSRFQNPAWGAILVALLSVLCKEALYRYTLWVGQRIDSPALMSNAWHHRSDALSSIAVIVGVVAARVDPALQFMDCAAALLVSTLIVKVGLSFVIDALKEFIDTAPDREVLKKIVHCAETIDGVTDVHDLRARTSGGKVFVEIHITVDGDMQVRQGHRVAKQVEACLIQEVEDLSKAIVHVDPTGEE